MTVLLQDLKHAFRTFREAPGFTVAVLAALTLGIGANTAIFSVLNAIVLKPIPFEEPDRLVRILNLNRETGATSGAGSPAKFMHWRAQTGILEDVAAVRSIALNYTAGDVPERIQAGQVAEAYLRALRAPMAEGRSFSPEDDLPGAPMTTVLTHGFWTERLGEEPGIVGSTVSLSGETYTVIGVTSPDLDLREFGDPDLFVPYQIDPNTTDQGHFFTVLARLAPAVTIEQAQERLDASAEEYRARYPDFLNENAGFTARTLQESMVGANTRRTLWIMVGAVSFVLLIACANVANLLLVRAAGRGREMAIRAALGAGRWRIVRQLLTESVVLAFGGGILGLATGFIGIRALLGVDTAGLPRLGNSGQLLGMDWRIVTFALVLSMATGVVFGLIPALSAARSDLSTVMKDSSGRSGSGLGQQRVRSALVVAELGLCVVLLVGAALLIRTSLAISRVDPGFTAANVLTMRTSLSDERFATAAGVEQISSEALARLRALPGVAEATAACCVPLQGGFSLPFDILGRAKEGPFTGAASWVSTAPGYFATFDIPIVRGRDFTELDGGGGPPVLIVNQAFVDAYWPDGGDPLADRLLIGGDAGGMRELAEEPVRQIVGVVGDVRANGLTNDPAPVMYLPLGQVPDALSALGLSLSPLAWIVRTQGEPATVAATIQQELREATLVPVTDVDSMEEIVSISTSRQRLNMLLMVVFGASALVLAAIGIYGLMAYSVQQRRQEIGIRMAMGADQGRIRRMVVRQGMALVGVGLASGLLAAYFLANVLASVVFEVQPRDPLVFAMVSAVLAAIAALAVAVPALRASRVDVVAVVRPD